MQSLKKYFFEGILIVFSVLFALFIDNYAQRLKVEKQKNLAIERIKLELSQNQKIAKGWLVHHGKILERIKNLMKLPKDSLKKEFSKDNYLTFALLSGGKPVTNELLSSTAWETAKSTAIIEEFDFQMIESLTRAYEHQNFLTDKTLNGIVNTYFERDSHELKNIDSTLKQFLIRFNELTAQERFLLKIYEKTSQKLK
jgi:hypothetical protein